MGGTIEIPIWLLVILLLGFAISIYRLLIDPLIRRTWRRWSVRAMEEVNPNLQLKLSPITLMRRRSLADRVAHDPILLKSIEPIAAERGVEVSDLKTEIEDMAYEIVPAFNPFFYFRLGYWMARHALRSFYRVRVGFYDEKSLEDVSGDNAVVFVSNHRSNVDYMLVTYLTSQRTMLSFGAGEWSQVFPIEQMLRSAGGYFVRRDSGDPLYRRVLERYVQVASEANVPHAIFPEGQLSTDGRLSPAKFGILSYLTRQFVPDQSPDLVFVPIACNYDRVPEDINVIEHDTFQFRQKGARYVIRSGVVFAFRAIWEMVAWRRSYGFACASFGRPVSMAAWLKERDLNWTEMDGGARYQVLTEFGNRIMDDIRALIPVTPVPVLCHVLREAEGKGEGARHEEKHLLDAFRACLERAEALGATVILPRNDSRLALLHALNQLCARRMLRQRSGRSYVINAEKSRLISYYANTIDHLVGDQADES